MAADAADRPHHRRGARDVRRRSGWRSRCTARGGRRIPLQSHVIGLAILLVWRSSAARTPSTGATRSRRHRRASRRRCSCSALAPSHVGCPRVHDLSPAELRVLGSLLEKQRTTPDTYPLTLNALRAACNQSTNRDPVVAYDEETIRDALHHLGRRRWTRLASGHGSRAAKYRHLLDEELRIGARGAGLLAVLMLRGPQTPGELLAAHRAAAPLRRPRRRCTPCSTGWSSASWSRGSSAAPASARSATRTCSAARPRSRRRTRARCRPRPPARRRPGAAAAAARRRAARPDRARAGRAAGRAGGSARGARGVAAGRTPGIEGGGPVGPVLRCSRIEEERRNLVPACHVSPRYEEKRDNPRAAAGTLTSLPSRSSNPSVDFEAPRLSSK